MLFRIVSLTLFSFISAAAIPLILPIPVLDIAAAPFSSICGTGAQIDSERSCRTLCVSLTSATQSPGNNCIVQAGEIFHNNLDCYIGTLVDSTGKCQLDCNTLTLAAAKIGVNCIKTAGQLYA